MCQKLHSNCPQKLHSNCPVKTKARMKLKAPYICCYVNKLARLLPTQPASQRQIPVLFVPHHFSFRCGK